MCCTVHIDRILLRLVGSDLTSPLIVSGQGIDVEIRHVRHTQNLLLKPCPRRRRLNLGEEDLSVVTESHSVLHPASFFIGVGGIVQRPAVKTKVKKHESAGTYASSTRKRRKRVYI